MLIFEHPSAFVTVSDCPSAELCDNLYLAESTNSYVMKGGAKVALSHLLASERVDRIIIDERFEDRYLVVDVSDAHDIGKARLADAIIDYFGLKKTISSGNETEVVALVHPDDSSKYWTIAKPEARPRMMNASEVLAYLRAAGMEFLLRTEVDFTSDVLLLDDAIQKIHASGLNGTQFLLTRVAKRERVIQINRIEGVR